jgi:succinylglutamic semialdehyde dehydrogenase
MSRLLTSVSPWDAREQVGQSEESDASSIASAVTRLEASAAAWANEPERRVRLLTGLGAILTRRRQEIMTLLVREAGKVDADAANEAELLVRKIAISLDAGLARTPQRAPAARSSGEPYPIWRPRGLAVVLGPYNFPLHLLHGLVAPALAVGATVLAKPSERCPALGALYRSCLDEAGLGGVCAVLNGGATLAQALTRLPGLATLAAVGGRATGLALTAALAGRPEVVLALELGGVNPALVLDDADLAAAAPALADGAWRLAGQRCTATRVVHVPARLQADLTALLVSEQRRWRPDGSPQGAIGPLIDRAASARMRAAYASLPSGLTCIAGSLSERSVWCACVEPLLLAVSEAGARQHPLYAEEQFVPALVIDPYQDADECLARLVRNPYRLAASVFTRSPERFSAAAARLPYGVVNHNRPTAGARSDQPFGGLGRSGNGRPAGLAAGALFADETVVWPAS